MTRAERLARRRFHSRSRLLCLCVLLAYLLGAVTIAFATAATSQVHTLFVCVDDSGHAVRGWRAYSRQCRSNEQQVKVAVKPAAWRRHRPTTTTTTTQPAPAGVLFADEFNGSSLDASKWYVSNSCANFGETNSCPSTANVSVTGGNLVARISRSGGGYRGALLSTVDYAAGAPYYPDHWKAGWQTPYVISVRALMPNTPGAWPAIWIRSNDGGRELDVAEERMTFPTQAGCHQHTWDRGRDTRTFDGGVTVSNMAANWHVYSAVVNSSSVTYRVDGLTCGVAYGIPTNSWHVLIIDNVLGAPGSWGSGGAQPAASDPGPWPMLVDWVRVTR